jgi:hypothetical protein
LKNINTLLDNVVTELVIDEHGDSVFILENLTHNTLDLLGSAFEQALFNDIAGEFVATEVIDLSFQLLVDANSADVIQFLSLLCLVWLLRHIQN